MTYYGTLIIIVLKRALFTVHTSKQLTSVEIAVRGNNAIFYRFLNFTKFINVRASLQQHTVIDILRKLQKVQNPELFGRMPTLPFNH